MEPWLYEVGFQPGHPLGFYSHVYAGEVARCQVLADPHGQVTRLRASTRCYPPALGRALVDGIWEADFATQAKALLGTLGDNPAEIAATVNAARVLTSQVRKSLGRQSTD